MTANLAAMLMTTGGLDGAVLLQTEGQRLGELSKQVAETNRALEELLATKLRDIHYATVIGELRAEIDALRSVMSSIRIRFNHLTFRFNFDWTTQSVVECVVGRVFRLY